jgi:predicted nucleic-acid-binding protein
MNKILRIVALGWVTCLVHLHSLAMPEVRDEHVGRVFYFGFEIERITGIHEEQIVQEGCAYVIPERVFLRLLRPNGDVKNRYRKRDVRALVTLSDATKYFVDHSGFVRSGANFYEIDKTSFGQSLSFVKKGKCR